MYGGNKSRNTFNAKHRVYVKKFKRSAFPNRSRQHWAVAQTGVARQRPRRMPWPYDITSMIFNQPKQGSDKIGYVVGNKMLKTAVVSTQHLVYYPKFNQRVSRVSRFFAHDEDMATVDGDLVHIKLCRKLSKYKHYYVFSILEPNIEARERLKLGLPAVAPPLFGYPVNRRIVKLNLTESSATVPKTTAAIQEHVQDIYRYGGKTGDSAKTTMAEASFDDAHNLIAPNADPIENLPQESGGDIAELGDVVRDDRQKRGEEFYAQNQPRGGAFQRSA